MRAIVKTRLIYNSKHGGKMKLALWLGKKNPITADQIRGSPVDIQVGGSPYSGTLSCVCAWCPPLLIYYHYCLYLLRWGEAHVGLPQTSTCLVLGLSVYIRLQFCLPAPFRTYSVFVPLVGSMKPAVSDPQNLLSLNFLWSLSTRASPSGPLTQFCRKSDVFRAWITSTFAVSPC